MKNIVVTTLAVFVSTSTCLNLIQPRGTPKVLNFNLERRSLPTQKQYSKRASFESGLSNYLSGFYYIVNITIGTPPQPLMVQFDTGSSDLVVNSPNTTCSQEGVCSSFGTYDPSKSSTSTTIAHNLADGYQLGGELGDWVSDTVHFYGQTLSKFVFGVGDNDNSTQIISIWGVGYASQLLGSTSPSNTTTLGAMVSAGIIGSRAFSIYLNSLTSSMGSVLFGGIDTSKFLGSLHSFPIVPTITENNGVENGTGYSRLSLNLSGVSINGGGRSVPTTAEFPATVMLDTGDFGIFLPDNFVKNVWETFEVVPVAISPGLTVGICNCSLANSSTTVDFAFSGLNISVPFSDIIFDVPTQILQDVGQTLPPGVCVFNINSLGGRTDIPFILGDAFLRSVYYVVDMESNEIALAPMNPNPGAENILEIAAGTVGVLSKMGASATGAAAAAATGSGATPTSTSSSASPSSSKSAGSQLKQWFAIPVSGMLAFFCLL